MTDKSMFDILSKFDSAGSRTVNESATATRSRSSSAGDPAMFDILSKFNDATLNEAGPGTYPSYGGMNTQMPADIADDEDLYKAVGDMQPEEEPEEPTAYEKEQEEVVAANEDAHDEPASEEEAEMAGDQIEYIKYAVDEIKDTIEAGNSFPEWFQNKLSGVYATLKDLHGYIEGDKRNDAEDEVMLSLEDVVSKDKRKGDDVVADKQAVDDIVQELSKSYADFVAQVEEERDDMSFFKKDKK